MLPSLSLASSPNSASVMVDKATSELLIGPDWTMNMEICDAVNSDHWMAKEAIKSVKKRLQHKSSRVQMLTLTLLETMVKNCGEQIHFHIAERKVLDEMIKIVKKRTDMQVRSMILMLLDSWQEAFGGPSGRHVQYYWAYDELRRSGVQFPPRSLDTAPIITPHATQPSIGHPQIGFGMPNNSSRRLDEAMASDSESLSISAMESVRSAVELLADMLQAVNPSDRMSVKDEVIVDVVDRCRNNQKKLMQMLATTTDEELLGQGLELNDAVQAVLAKHDAIASGSPLPPTHLITTTSSHQNESPASNSKPSESGAEGSSPATISKPPSADAVKDRALEEEEEDEDDEFAQLARRHSRPSTVPGKSEDGASSSSSNGPTLEAAMSNALVLADPPPQTPMEGQDMADFLSIVLSTSYASESEPISETHNPVPSETNSYVAPWSQQTESSNQPNPYEYSSAYPPPPWAATTPGYANEVTTNDQYSYSLPPTQMQQNPQHMNSLPNGGQKPTYVPSYRLFEDLNVFGNAEGKTKSGPYSSASSGQSTVTGR